MPKKIRELKAALRKAGFSSKPEREVMRSGNMNSFRRRLSLLERKDGSDAKPYLEEQVREALERLEQMKTDRSQEEQS